MYRKILFVTFVCFFTFGSDFAFGQAVARILEVNGSVTIQESSGAQRPAAMYGGLFAEESLNMGENASVTLLWKSDQRLEKLTTTETKTVAVRTDRLEPAEGVEPVKSTSRPSPRTMEKIGTSLPDISPAGGIIPRSPKENPTYPNITPAKGTTLTTSQPQFTWPANEGAKDYFLQIFEGDDQVPILDRKVAVNNFALPKKSALEPGLDYRWQVQSKDANGKVIVWEGAVAVPSADDLKMFAEVELWTAELLAAKEAAALAAVASFYDKKHCYNEALALYQQLCKLQPKQAEHWAAVAELYHRAGQEDEAKKSHDIAVELGYKFEKK